MYVHRQTYETELRRAIRSKYHIIIFGDSGCGKSWLYKKVFEEAKVAYETIDLSAVESPDDFDLALLDIVTRKNPWVEVERETENVRSAMPADIGYRKGGVAKFVKGEESAFFQVCQLLRSEAKSRRAFIVFENLEHAVSSKDVLIYLRSLLLLLDDERFAEVDVQICMIGVPSDLKSLLSDGNKYQTISNRVIEISEVSRMSKDEAKILINQGFRRELEMDIESPDLCVSQIIFLTQRIPQYIHDVCLQVAFVAEEQGTIVNPDAVMKGARTWVETNARQHREFIDGVLGRGKRRTDQKSRVIYAISRCETSTFYALDIETILRETFPKSVGIRRVQVLKTLNDLSQGEKRILRKDEALEKFRIVTPKLRSVLRYCLDFDPADEAVLIRSGDRH